LESFSQRLSARCYLAPFNREESWQYIRAQIAACGATPEDVFAADGPAAVFDATDGVPRLVNQLCDRALHFALQAGQARVDRTAIQQAWSDLQQLPTPWETPVEEVVAEASEVIEFGHLRDDLIAAGRTGFLDARPGGDRSIAHVVESIRGYELVGCRRADPAGSQPASVEASRCAGC
jgi:hypothetical protein